MMAKPILLRPPPMTYLTLKGAFSNEVSTGSGTTNGLVAYWAMDDGSGTTASDSSGLGNNGVVNGGATWTTGKVGGGIEF